MHAHRPLAPVAGPGDATTSTVCAGGAQGDDCARPGRVGCGRAPPGQPSAVEQVGRLRAARLEYNRVT